MRTSVSSPEPTEKPGIMAHAYNPSAGEAETEKHPEHSGWPASPRY